MIYFLFIAAALISLFSEPILKIIKTESGEIKKAGCFLEDLVIENMKNQGFGA